MNKSVIVAIIPARGNSKRIFRKNYKLLNSKPLVSYAIKLAKEAKRRGLIAGHIVSTDDKEIAVLSKRFGGNAPFLRPAKFACDSSSTIYAVLHAVRWWENKHGERIHSVLLLQPTNPLTVIEDIEEALKIYIAGQPKTASLISVCDAQHLRPQTLYYGTGKHLAPLLDDGRLTKKRNKKIYWRNGAIYIARRDLMFEGKKMIADKPLYYEMPQARSIAIDNMHDWLLAEMLLKRRK